MRIPGIRANKWPVSSNPPVNLQLPVLYPLPYLFPYVFKSFFFLSLFTDVATFFPQTTPARSFISVVLHVEGRSSSPRLRPASFKVLSVGVGGDGDVDDEGRLVLDASVLAVGEGSDLHAVRVGLS